MKDGSMEAKIIALPNLENIVKGIILSCFPVGTILQTTNETNPAEYLGGTWTQIAEGRVLQGADLTHKAGTNVAAGLPNITGTVTKGLRSDSEGNYASGAFYPKFENGFYPQGSTSTNATVYFDASHSNPIYGNADTVQPPAYVVYMWQRIA